MLLHIPQILSPDLLKFMMEMGHNDELVICDGNFPKSAYPDRVVYCTAAGTAEILNAILYFLPLDNGSEEPLIQMAIEQGSNYSPVTWPKYDDILKKYGYVPVKKKFLSRGDFYARAKQAYAVVLTGEPSFYATIILKKGTVPDQMDILKDKGVQK
jgi:L-fucose mutarotase